MRLIPLYLLILFAFGCNPGSNGPSRDVILIEDGMNYYGKKINDKKESSSSGGNGNSRDAEKRAQQAFELVLETLDDISSERGEESRVWGSMVKQALKRRKPSFSENYHGFRSFGILLEEMRERELLTLEHDPKSGGYIISSYSSD